MGEGEGGVDAVDFVEFARREGNFGCHLGGVVVVVVVVVVVSGWFGGVLEDCNESSILDVAGFIAFDC